MIDLTSNVAGCPRLVCSIWGAIDLKSIPKVEVLTFYRFIPNLQGFKSSLGGLDSGKRT